jgi:hypothetical protein
MDSRQEEAFNKLKPHEQRMVKEYEELSDRFVKLDKFISSDNEIWNKLDCEERDDMIMQRNAMHIYGMTLYRRLKRAHLPTVFNF